jgi:hypothetical protein
MAGTIDDDETTMTNNSKSLQVYISFRANAMNLSQLTTSRLILLGITIGLLQAQQFEPRCGDCWW